MEQQSSSTHPAPHRDKVGMAQIMAGLFGAPACWLAQMSLSDIISSYACYPHRVPLHAPLWNWMHPALSVIGSLALCGAILSCLIAWHTWRLTKNEKAETGHAIDVGEGRTRFLAAFGLMSSILFIISIVFTGFACLLVSPCGQGG